MYGAASFSGVGDSATVPTKSLRRARGVIGDHLRAALRLLQEANEYAADLGLDAWAFAVELEVLRSIRLTNSDLRWLCMAGLVEHAYEVSEYGDELRRFQRGGPLFTVRSCFVATAAGLATAHDVGEAPAAPRVSLAVTPTLETPGEMDVLPKWDDQRRQVRIGRVVVKEFKLPAQNQETILTAFEEEGWPPRIDDPLSPVAEVEPKRRLHDAIQALNRNQRNDLLRFMGDGSGEGIRWELRPAAYSAR